MTKNVIIKGLSFFTGFLFCGCAMMSSVKYATRIPLTAKLALVLAVQSFDEARFGPINQFTVSIHDTPETTPDHSYLIGFDNSSPGGLVVAVVDPMTKQVTYHRAP